MNKYFNVNIMQNDKLKCFKRKLSPISSNFWGVNGTNNFLLLIVNFSENFGIAFTSMSILGLVMLVISPGNCSESYETRTQSPTANDSTPSSNISSSSSPEVLEPELSSFSLVA